MVSNEGSIQYKDLSEVVYTPETTKNGKGDVKLMIDGPKKQSDPLFLYLATITANMLMFVAGCSFAWTSPVIPKLKNAAISPFGFAITSKEESWLAAILAVGAALGPIATGPCADRIGRKKTMIVLAVPMLVGYAVLALGKNLELYYLARFIIGLGVGSVFGLLPMYIAEISEDNNRGKFCCFSGIFATLGLLYPSLAGPVLNIAYFNVSCCIPLVVFLVIFPIFMPDTPVYLCTIPDRDAAEKTLMKLRNKDSKNVQKELDEMLRNAEKDKENQGGFRDLFGNKGNRKGIFITASLLIIQQLSGISAVIGFMQPIFEATGSSISAELAAIAVGLVQVFVAFVTMAIVERLGRKTLLLASLAGCAASIILLGLYFFLKQHQYNVASIFWLPILCLAVYIIAFNVGMGPLPWLVMSEIFPPNVRSIAASLTSFTAFVASFGVTLVFPIICESLGIDQTFWMFGACCTIGVAFVSFVVPETKGKTLAQIQEQLGS